MSRKRSVRGVVATGLVVISVACGGKKDENNGDPKAGSAVVEAKAPPPDTKPSRPEFSTAFYLDTPKVKVEGDNIKVLTRILHSPKQPVATTLCLRLLDGKGAKVADHEDGLYDDHQSLPRGAAGKVSFESIVEPSAEKRGTKVEAMLVDDGSLGCTDAAKRRSNVVTVDVGKPGAVANAGKQDGDAKTFPFVIDDFTAEYTPSESTNAYGQKSGKNLLRVSGGVHHRGDQPVQVPGGCLVIKDGDGFDLGTLDLEGVEMASGGEAEIHGDGALDAGKAAKATQFLAYISNYSCRDKPKDAISNALKFGKDGK